MIKSAFRTVFAIIFTAILATPVGAVELPVGMVTAKPTAAELGIPEENLPIFLGQSQVDAYVPESGHSVTGYMLDYWRANGAASVYGNPISQPFGASNQLYSQAFERGIFQYSPVWLYSDDAAVRLMPIVKNDVDAQRSELRSDGRRQPADRRTSMMPASMNTVRAQQVAAEGGRISSFTGYSISGAFGAWYERHEGWFYMGSPVSEPMRIRGVEGQMFENGILLIQDGVVQVAPLPRENPGKYGINTTPIEQGNRPVYSEAMFYTSVNPYGVDPTAFSGQKHIVVDVTEQTLRAYKGDVLVLETLVSTGKEPNETEIGFFHVRIKYESQTMQGFADGTGEVISLGAEGDEGEHWMVEDVPHIMYFNYEAEAIHGAYWHDNFGNRQSHGCVNLRLDVAEFLWEFSPLGTPVTVIE
jgi:hypothetical protein